MRKSILLLVVVSLFLLGFTATSYAFREGGYNYNWPAVGGGPNGVGWGAGSNLSTPPTPASPVVQTGSCGTCHSDNTGQVDASGTPIPAEGAWGPHAGFAETTDKCNICHDIHEAANPQLLIDSTTFGVCNTCHDLSYTSTAGTNPGTAAYRAGGGGVYGAIRAQGGTVRARHNIQGYNNTSGVVAGTAIPYFFTSSYLGGADTGTIPGGSNAITNPDDQVTPSSLTCVSCHTPHNNTQLAAFRGERRRQSATKSSPLTGLRSIEDTAQWVTTKLLKDSLNGIGNEGSGPYTVYGTLWCAACHNKRHSANTIVNNHPTDNSGAYGYNSPQATADNTIWAAFVGPQLTPSGNIWVSHEAGFSRVATTGSTWAPLCQQCHYSARNVEAASVIATIDGRSVTSIPSTDNPRWQNFPHESENFNFLVESKDDLCLNCHPTSSLP